MAFFTLFLQIITWVPISFMNSRSGTPLWPCLSIEFVSMWNATEIRSWQVCAYQSHVMKCLSQFQMEVGTSILYIPDIFKFESVIHISFPFSSKHKLSQTWSTQIALN